MYQALMGLRDEAKITPESFPKTVFTLLEQVPGQPEKPFSKFRPWYYRIKEPLFNAEGEEKLTATAEGGKYCAYYVIDVSEHYG